MTTRKLFPNMHRERRQLASAQSPLNHNCRANELQPQTRTARLEHKSCSTALRQPGNMPSSSWCHRDDENAAWLSSPDRRAWHVSSGPDNCSGWCREDRYCRLATEPTKGPKQLSGESAQENTKLLPKPFQAASLMTSLRWTRIFL